MNKEKLFSKICLIYFIAFVCFVFLRILFSLGVINISNEYVADALSTGLIQIAIMGAIPIVGYFIVKRKENSEKTNFKEVFSDFGFNKIALKTIILALLLGVCVYIFNMFISSFFDSLISSLGYESAGSGSGGIEYNSVPTLLWGVLMVAVFPAVFEEIAHRGLLLGVGKKSIGAKNAILLSGLCFGLMHLNINQFFYATIIGLFIGFIAYISKSIFPAMIIHFVNNAINVYFSYASNTGRVGSDWFSKINGFLSSANVVLVILTVVVVVFILALITVCSVISIYNQSHKDNPFMFRLLTPESVKSYLQKPEVVSQVLSYKTEQNQIAEKKDEVIMPADADLNSTFFPEKKEKLKFEFKYKIFFFAIIILGALTTLFTFIWGVL